MLFETILVGALGVNCFLVGDEASNEAVVVDPGADGDAVLDAIDRSGMQVKYIINTHGHFDHIGAVQALKEATGATYLIHEKDLHLLSVAERSARMYGLSAKNAPQPDRFLTDGLRLEFGSLAIEVLHTPGHTPGGCCLYLCNEKLVITGDTLFADSIGRTDLPGGSLKQLLSGIREKLMTLPDDVVVWPGHGPSTTIGREKRSNPYING